MRSGRQSTGSAAQALVDNSIANNNVIETVALNDLAVFMSHPVSWNCYLSNDNLSIRHMKAAASIEKV